MSFADDDDLVLAKGSTYVAVLLPVLDSVQKPSGNDLLLTAWQLDEKGLVRTEADGDLPLDKVQEGLTNGVEPTPPPSPGESDSIGPG